MAVKTPIGTELAMQKGWSLSIDRSVSKILTNWQSNNNIIIIIIKFVLQIMEFRWLSVVPKILPCFYFLFLFFLFFLHVFLYTNQQV